MMFKVKILKGVYNSENHYFDTLVEARIFANNNGGGVYQIIKLDENYYYWKRV